MEEHGDGEGGLDCRDFPDALGSLDGAVFKGNGDIGGEIAEGRFSGLKILRAIAITCYFGIVG